MGLFSRTKDDEKEEDEFLDLPNSQDLDESFLDEEDIGKPSRPATREKHAPSPKKGFSVEDAIQLMRKLPKNNNELVVTVVKKTLETLHIELSDIIDDARKKEDSIKSQRKKLERDIKSLEDQINDKNQKISQLKNDLSETSNVRQQLQLALDLDKKLNPPSTPPAEKPASDKTNNEKINTHSASNATATQPPQPTPTSQSNPSRPPSSVSNTADPHSEKPPYTERSK